MSIIGNRYLQGQPILPYASVKAYPNTDIFIDLTFVDHLGVPVVPATIILELDDITNDQAMVGGAPITLNPAGSTVGPILYTAFATEMTLQFVGSPNAGLPGLQMTFQFGGSQYCQLKLQFTATDTGTGNPFTSTAPIAVIELCADASVTGF